MFFSSRPDRLKIGAGELIIIGFAKQFALAAFNKAKSLLVVLSDIEMGILEFNMLDRLCANVQERLERCFPWLDIFEKP